MVSPSKPNQAKLREKTTEPKDSFLLKTTKPFADFKFYLDIKNRAVSSKLETKIKQLGGNIEVFLVREVTNVVTDQLGFQLNVPATPPTPSPGPSPCLSNESGSLASPAAHIKAVRPRPKSRADAMLERVRQQPQALQTSNGPLDIARSWSIPIWTVERALKYIDRLSTVAKAKLLQIDRQKKSKTKILNDSFVKIENCARDCRPSYKELKQWPNINISGGYFGISPFTVTNVKDLVLPKNLGESKVSFEKDKESHKNINIGEPKLIPKSSNRMTRRSRLRHRTREPVKSPQRGFCEICHVDYPDLAKHARSETHLNFVRNDGNFLTLDTLISAGANVEAFLKLNGTVKELSTNNYGFGRRSLRSVVKPHETNSIKEDEKIMPANLEMLNEATDRCSRVTRKSNSDRILSLSKLSQSEKSSENSHRLRSRGQICIPSNLLGTTAEDECKSVKSLPNNRSDIDKRSSRSNGKILDDVSVEIVKRKRVRSIRWRCPSPGARPIVPASPCYKVVGTRGKSRADNKKSDDDPGLVVKFKRVRQSELSTLSDEAESFMFPKREESDNETDDDRQSSEKDLLLHTSSELQTSEPVKAKYTSEVTRTDIHDLSIEPVNRTRRRRTQAEAFIGDNTNYYKFQATDSRLRFQTAPIQPQATEELTSLRDEDLSSDKEEVEEESERETGEQNGVSVDDWVGASTLEQTGYAPSAEIETLTFSFEYVPRNEPWYNTYKRQDEGKEFKSVTSEDRPSCSYSKPVVLPYQIGILPPLQPNCCQLNKIELKTETETESTSTLEVKKKRPRKQFPVGKNSRKSPREHASTLATLASLVQQRKKRDSKDSTKNNDNDLTSIPEEEVSSSYSTPVRGQTENGTSVNHLSEIESIEKSVDEMLSQAYDEMEDFEIEVEDPCVRLDKPDIEDIVELIETFSECSVMDMDLQRHFKNSPSAVGKQDGRLRKKRKKNRTGWPSKKKILVKKENNKSDVSVSASEVHLLDKSVVTSDYGTGLTKICESINDIEITMQVSEKGSTELSNDSCIVTTVSHEQIDSCSNTTDSGKENQCTNEKTVVFDSADIYTLSSRFESNNKTDILKVFANGSANTAELVMDKNKSADGRDISETVSNNEENLHLKKNAEVWESAERALSKLSRNQQEEDELSDDRRSSREFQPFVCVQKIDESGTNRRLRSSSSSRSSFQPRAKRQRQGSPRNITPSCSPRPIVSPRRLRVPRGRWYRER